MPAPLSQGHPAAGDEPASDGDGDAHEFPTSGTGDN